MPGPHELFEWDVRAPQNLRLYSFGLPCQKLVLIARALPTPCIAAHVVWMVFVLLSSRPCLGLVEVS